MGRHSVNHSFKRRTEWQEILHELTSRHAPKAASAALQVVGNRKVSVFVGQWAPTFLILGVYNKLVKQLGSDRTENAV